MYGGPYKQQDWRLFSPKLPENIVQGAAEPNTQMSAYPIFDKFGKLAGEKIIWKLDKIWLC